MNKKKLKRHRDIIDARLVTPKREILMDPSDWPKLMEDTTGEKFDGKAAAKILEEKYGTKTDANAK